MSPPRPVLDRTLKSVHAVPFETSDDIRVRRAISPVPTSGPPIPSLQRRRLAFVHRLVKLLRELIHTKLGLLEKCSIHALDVLRNGRKSRRDDTTSDAARCHLPRRERDGNRPGRVRGCCRRRALVGRAVMLTLRRPPRRFPFGVHATLVRSLRRPTGDRGLRCGRRRRAHVDVHLRFLTRVDRAVQRYYHWGEDLVNDLVVRTSPMDIIWVRDPRG